MTLIDRIHAAVATRNTACIAAYNATMAGVTMLAQEPTWPGNTPQDFLAFWLADLTVARAREAYATAIRQADEALVAAIEAAIAEGTGE